MGKEIDLLQRYPKTPRDTKGRGSDKTPEVQSVARKFGEEFFDGDRLYGYGGFEYQQRFWDLVVPDMQQHFSLSADSRLLDIGCAKGFMLYDFIRLIPGIEVKGIDISEYAIANSMDEVKAHLQVANAVELPFADDSFDLVIAINTIHNLEPNECFKALQEIERVSRGRSFLTVDAYRNDEERERMLDWNLTAKTILHVDEWRKLFEEAGYSGDYFWFIP